MGALLWLLGNGADVNAVARCGNPRRDGATAVYVASMNNSAEALRVLLDHGADVNQPLDNGASSMFIAKYTDSEDAYEILEARGGELKVPLKGVRIAIAVVFGVVTTPVVLVAGIKTRGAAAGP